MKLDAHKARKVLQEIFADKSSILRQNLIQKWLQRSLVLEDLNLGIELMKTTGEIDEAEWEGDDVRYDLIRMED